MHSISFTGGEPLLHADFIKDFLEKYPLTSMLETNGSLPGELAKLTKLVDYVSMDVKLPEHEAVSNWDDLLDQEIKSIKLLIEEGINSYCKVVVHPSTTTETVALIASRIREEIKTSQMPLIIQPISPWNYGRVKPTSYWKFPRKQENISMC